MKLQTCELHNRRVCELDESKMLSNNSKSYDDSRYKRIISRLDEIIELVRQQPDRQLTTELNHLQREMLNHIGSENNIMDIVNYPQTARHRSHHNHIYGIFYDLSYRLRMGQSVLPDELVSVRLLWLLHIKMHDQALEDFLTY